MTDQTPAAAPQGELSKRLREKSRRYRIEGEAEPLKDATLEAAADELDRLAAENAALNATVADAKRIMQRIREVCEIKTKPIMSFSGQRYEQMIDEWLAQPGGEKIIAQLKELSAKVTPGLNYWEWKAKETAAENAALRAELAVHHASVRPLVDAFEKLKNDNDAAAGSGDFADALRRIWELAGGTLEKDLPG